MMILENNIAEMKFSRDPDLTFSFTLMLKLEKWNTTEIPPLNKRIYSREFNYLLQKMTQYKKCTTRHNSRNERKEYI